MAGDWIKMRADLFTHPKVEALAVRFGKDELWAVGALFAFWVWADKHCVDGHVDGATSRLVDRATSVDGLANALVDIGWLIIDDTGVTIPSFDEHNGESAKERSQKNQRQARWRDRKAAGLVDVEASTQTSTKASTREEKRREDIKAPIVPTGDEEAILSAYHSILPKCKRSEVLNPKRKKRIAAVVKLAKSVCASQGWPYDAANFWRAYFGECAKDPWMRGDVPYKDNPNWKQNLETLIGEDRFAGVMDDAIASMRGAA